MNCRPALAALLLAAGCGSPVRPAIALADSAAVLLGEQHDAPEHQRFHLSAVQAFAGRGVLAALALEMAEEGKTTAGLPPDSTESRVRDALAWNEQAWPWESYGPAVMAAIAAGVPVNGANLARGRIAAALNDASLDSLLPPAALQAQMDAVRTGHCGLLPEARIRPMTRVQIARDRAMAHTLVRSRVPGKTVLLLAGAGHVDRMTGVPRHLPADFENQSVELPAPATPPKDYCAEMRRSMQPRPAP